MSESRAAVSFARRKRRNDTSSGVPGERGRGGPGKVRIIGGAWRGRKLAVRNCAGLRPSTDRVRETLFNWLQGRIVGARCLDLFTGSGALGLEALSRGAAHCTFVDIDAANVHHIQRLLVELGAGDRARCNTQCAAAMLEQPQPLYDLIFVDPPFASHLLARVTALLERSGACNADTLIYIEQDARDGGAAVPAHWQVWREKRAGNVRFGLYQLAGAGPDASTAE